MKGAHLLKRSIPGRSKALNQRRLNALDSAKPEGGVSPLHLPVNVARVTGEIQRSPGCDAMCRMMIRACQGAVAAGNTARPGCRYTR
jgi:hypothetical protein